MTWVKMDDKRGLHRKLRAAGFAARGLDEAAICQCACEETDGFVANEMLAMLGSAHGERAVGKLAKRLVECNRWTRDEALGGYWIVDYLHYNPSHARLEAQREADRIRKGRRSDSGRIPAGFQPESTLEAIADSEPPRVRARAARPDPSRPVEELAAPAAPDPSAAEAPKARPQRPRDFLWEAIAEEAGIDWATAPKGETGRVTAAAGQLRQIGATPEQVVHRADAWRRKYPTIAVTPQVLSNHWTELAVAPAPASFDAGRRIDNLDPSLLKGFPE